VSLRLLSAAAAIVLAFVPAISSAQMKKIVLANFEEPFADIQSYHGPRSTLYFFFQNKIVHSGKYALKVSAQVNDPSLLYFTGKALPAWKGDWRGMKTLSLWIYGSKTYDVFDIYLQDKELEEFGVLLVNNWNGWKKISIPISDFHSRLDWQPEGAKVNRKIDYPLNQLILPCFYYARTILYFDDIEVTSD
jgi:hypothetical protein